MKHPRSIFAAALALALSTGIALAQSGQGSSPLTGPKGGTNNGFMQFTGPASSLKTYTLPNASGTVDLLNAAQTFTAAKTFNSSTLLLAGSSSGVGTLNAPAAASNYVWTLPASTDTLVGRATTDTLTNKTLTSPAITTPTGIVKGDVGLGNVDNTSDATKNAASATLTNKTITSPVIATIVNSGTLTLPTATDTLVGRATTDTLTNKTFNTQGTGNVFTLNGAAFGTATQATAALNAMVGDSGSGGTKGLVPAPGAGDAAAGKYLKADGTFAVPPGTGGGGSYPDADRQNSLLVKIYQSKSFAGYRRFINEFATGFKGASDALNGILTASSSNYTVNSSSGYVAPSVGADTYASVNDPTLTSDGSSVSNYSFRQVITAANLGSNNGDRLRVTFRSSSANPATITAAYIGAKGASAPNFDGTQVQITFNGGSASATIPTNTTLVSDPITYAFDRTKDLVISTELNGALRYVTSSTGYTRYVKNPATGEADDTTVSGYSSDTTASYGIDLIETRTATGATNNMTLVTAAQTSDSSVSNSRILIEYDHVASPSLNTDLTAEVSCNGGTNWASASLSAVTSYAGTSTQRRVVESVDQSCGANTGTDFRARLKTFNNKNVPVYGLSLTVH